jgi:hypothetical protein
VNGRATSFLLDTGATDHAIALWLARELRLGFRVGPADDVIDHAGTRLEARRTEGATVEIDEWGAIEQKRILVVDTPEVFARSDVGGILSPQLLAHAGDSVRLDLREKRMMLEATADARARLSAETGCWLSAAPSNACGSAPSGVDPAPLFVLPAAVDDKSINMLVDTGAIRTDVDPSLVEEGQARTPHLAFTLAGASLAPAVGASLSVGACMFEREVDIMASLRNSTCPRQGSLGIDALRSCDLELDQDRVWGRCTPMTP